MVRMVTSACIDISKRQTARRSCHRRESGPRSRSAHDNSQTGIGPRRGYLFWQSKNLMLYVRNTRKERSERQSAPSGKAAHLYMPGSLYGRFMKQVRSTLPIPIDRARTIEAREKNRPDEDSPGTAAGCPPWLAEVGGMHALPRSTVAAVDRKSRSGCHKWTMNERRRGECGLACWCCDGKGRG